MSVCVGVHVCPCVCVLRVRQYTPMCLRVCVGCASVHSVRRSTVYPCVAHYCVCVSHGFRCRSDYRYTSSTGALLKWLLGNVKPQGTHVTHHTAKGQPLLRNAISLLAYNTPPPPISFAGKPGNVPGNSRLREPTLGFEASQARRQQTESIQLQFYPRCLVPRESGDVLFMDSFISRAH